MATASTMTRKTPPYKNWDKWTQSRFWSFIRSALRRAYNRYPPKYVVLEEAKIINNGIIDDKRTKFVYQCASCKQHFKRTDIQVDHKIQAGSLKDYSDLPQFVENLFCGVDDLQVLCKKCHNKKTAQENKR